MGKMPSYRRVPGSRTQLIDESGRVVDLATANRNLREHFLAPRRQFQNRKKVVELSESDRRPKSVQVSEADRLKRRKALHMQTGMSEAEAEIAASGRGSGFSSFLGE